MLQLTKRYYEIGEVADMLGVATSLIRFWEEDMGIKLHHKRSLRKHRRLFRPHNIERLERMVYAHSLGCFTVQGIKQIGIGRLDYRIKKDNRLHEDNNLKKPHRFSSED